MAENKKKHFHKPAAKFLTGFTPRCEKSHLGVKSNTCMWKVTPRCDKSHLGMKNLKTQWYKEDS